MGIRLIDHITMKAQNKPLRVYADDRSNLWLKVNRLVEIMAPRRRTSSSPRCSTRESTRSSRATGRRRGRSSRSLRLRPKDMPTKLLPKR